MWLAWAGAVVRWAPTSGVAHASVIAGRAAAAPATTRQFTSSPARQDVRRVMEGRFSRPAPAAGEEVVGEAATWPVRGPAPELNISPARRRIGTFFRFFLPLAGTATLVYAFTHPDDEPLVPRRLPPELQYLAVQQSENQEVFTNWSATHEAKPKRVLQPETEADVEVFVRQADKSGQKLRVAGSGLSPNGLAFSEDGMMTMALMDKVLSIDTDKQQVTVQAGCRVQQLADALAPHGLTLQNFASIREQQIGGFTQVGAHGTGALIPPVEEQIVSMRLVTPALGTLTLSQDSEPELFQMAKVGLGALGVVTQVTLQCVPRHRLVERTFTTSAAEVKKHHTSWLKEHKHLRYMWIPYTDDVVVVQCNPEPSTAGAAALAAAAQAPAVDDATRLAPLRDLLASKAGEGVDVTSLSHTQLRDELLALAPTDQAWVAQVNHAEAAVWRRSAGVRTGWSDEILGFDCGGQQWVHEVCFPVGKLGELKGVTKDIQYMEALLKEIKAKKIAAPVPIEQRWSRGSGASMSPSAGPPDSLHSWVGIIMYLPPEPAARKQVTDAFGAYFGLVRDKLMPKYGAATHWAKQEVPPPSSAELRQLQARLAARYPLAKFNAYRSVLDPNNILANEWVDALFAGA